MKNKNIKPEIIRSGMLDMQVCVPSEWTDKQVIEFAGRMNFCGTINRWQIRKKGDKLLGGDNERVKCEEKDGYVHIMLDA